MWLKISQAKEKEEENIHGASLKANITKPILCCINNLFVLVDNLEHSDFVALRNLLIRNYMLDLLDTTNNVHYENYRCRKLSGIGSDRQLPSKDGSLRSEK